MEGLKILAEEDIKLAVAEVGMGKITKRTFLNGYNRLLNIEYKEERCKQDMRRRKIKVELAASAAPTHCVCLQNGVHNMAIH